MAGKVGGIINSIGNYSTFCDNSNKIMYQDFQR